MLRVASGARFAAVATIAGGVGAALAVACSASLGESAIGPPGDAGAPDGPYAVDASPDVALPDGGGGDGAMGVPPATLTFLHAASGLRTLRLCWAVDGKVTGDPPFPPYGTMMPESNYAGIPVGGTAFLADAQTLAGHTLTFYALDAETFATLLEPGHESTGCDYWKAHLDPSLFHGFADTTGIVPDAGNVVVLSGSATALATQVVHTHGPAPTPAGTMSVQAIQLSPGLALLAGDAGVRVSFGSPSADAATWIADFTTTGDIEPGQVVAIDVGTDLASFGERGFFVEAVAPDASAYWWSLVASESLVDPTRDPRTFFGGHVTYLVAVMGDPSPDSGMSGSALHTLVVPSP
jgi:hypothetical protein